LEYASDNLRNDPDIVKCAVAEAGLALQYASDELRNSTDIVKTAVDKDWRALQFASDRLRNDCDMVSHAIIQNRDAFERHWNWSALQFASDQLRKNPDIVNIVKAAAAPLHPDCICPDVPHEMYCRHCRNKNRDAGAASGDIERRWFWSWRRRAYGRLRRTTRRLKDHYVLAVGRHLPVRCGSLRDSAWCLTS